MALTINATLKDPHANSYVEVAYCDGYWAQHFAPTKAAQWAALTSDQKTLALIQACSMVEMLRFTRHVNPGYAGEQTGFYNRNSGRYEYYPISSNTTPVKFDPRQALQFPRNIDRDLGTGDVFIPEAVAMAQCEQAVYLLGFDESVLASTLQGIREDSLQIGSLRTLQKYERNGTALAPMAKEFLRPFIIRGSARFERA